VCGSNQVSWGCRVLWLTPPLAAAVRHLTGSSAAYCHRTFLFHEEVLLLAMAISWHCSCRCSCHGPQACWL
jgi:hypothetical protein